MRKPTFCIYAKTRKQISFAVTAKLICVFVFATWIVQYLYFLNTKLQASSHLQWLSSLFGRSRECHNKITKPIPSTKKKGKLSRTESTQVQVNNSRKMSHDVRKPNFCICENKDADQCPCFRYTDSTIPLFHKYQISSL